MHCLAATTIRSTLLHDRPFLCCALFLPSSFIALGTRRQSPAAHTARNDMSFERAKKPQELEVAVME